MVSDDFTHLFTPLGLGPVEIPNRICWSAHSTHLASNGLTTERQVDYYSERARGGAGWIVVGGSVARREDLWEQGFNVVSDPQAIPGYQRLTQAVHKHGAKITTQVSFYGLGVPPDRPFPGPVYAPSNRPTAIEGEIPKRVDSADMNMFEAAMVASVENALEGGFDGIELLWSFDTSLEQNFLSPRFNDRTDEYGGSLDNRMRFPLRIVEAARSALAGRGVLGLKIVGDEMVEGGLGQSDVQEICRQLDARGLVDYFHLCLGTRSNYQLMIPEMSYPAGFAVYLAAGVREVVNVPVVAVKRIDDPRMAEQVLSDGHADVIGMTRALIADPDLPAKARDGKLDEIRQCTSSNQECSRRAAEHIKLPIRCIHNPAAGFEGTLGRRTLRRVTDSRSVMVIGGGPAGMRAAKVAAQAGHQVRLFEQSDSLGGQVLSILRVPSRQGYDSILRYLRGELDRRGVDVRLGVHITRDVIAAEAPDAVIVATGALGLKTGYSAALPHISEMPGADQDHVLTVFDVFANPHAVGDRVVLVDEMGQYESMVTAEYLGHIGKHVTHVTRQPVIGGKVDGGSRHEYGLRLADYGVASVPRTAVTEIDGNVVRGTDEVTRREWSQEADSVVLMMGKLPNEALFLDLQRTGADVRRAGDCVAPRQITDAIFEGNLAGRQV